MITRRIFYTFVLFTGTTLILGCGGSRGSMFDRSDDRDPIDVALTSDAPDERRTGVERLADSRDAATPWAIEIYTTMAREDVDDMVRQTALRALDKHDTDAAQRLSAELMAAYSSSTPVRETKEGAARPTGPVLRRAAGRILLRHARTNTLATELNIAPTLCGALKNERDHQTRIILIDTAGYVTDRSILDALIEAMRRDDFAEKRAAEDALVRLTGVTHRYDADAWQNWLAGRNQPFARAGELTPTSEASKKGAWWNPFD